MAAGRFAEAQALCVTLFPESSEPRDAVLAEILERAGERSDVAIAQAYHKWYYDSLVWGSITWLGVPILKSPMDMWSYQEIICQHRPALIIEFGTYQGGSALFFRNVLDIAGIDAEIVTVDIADAVHPGARARAGIRFVLGSSTGAEVGKVLAEMVARRPGRIVAILDSDHRADHVFDEMLVLRDILTPGDYLIVEDSNINGHPVLPDWGPGPFEAIERYEREFPNDYHHDLSRELKFGWTFAPNGFLIRN
jgi:cephalosporin hydroxylase